MIELMVVVSVMSVLTLGVVLGFGGGQSLSPNAGASDPARQAQALEQAVAQASDLALFTRQPVGLQPLRQGWQVLRRNADGIWMPEQRLGARTQGLALDWQIGARPYQASDSVSTERPAIDILGDGRSTPFTVRLSPVQGALPAHVCRSTGGQRASCDPL